jgi:putative flippase GtrA
MAIEHPFESGEGYRAERALGLARAWAERIAASLGRDFLYFLLLGGFAALVNLAVGSLLYGAPSVAAHCPYWLAVGVGATSGLFVNFLLNYHYNFRFRGRSALAQFRTFCVVAVGGIVLTALFSSWIVMLLDSTGTAALLARLELPLALSPDFMAHFAAVALVTVYSYAAHKLFTFNVGIRRRVRGLVLALHG